MKKWNMKRDMNHRHCGCNYIDVRDYHDRTIGLELILEPQFNIEKMIFLCFCHLSPISYVELKLVLISFGSHKINAKYAHKKSKTFVVSHGLSVSAFFYSYCIT